jgi:hypothetical protein
MDEEEDPDWTSEARQAEFAERVGPSLLQIMNSHVLDVTTLDAGTRLIVTTLDDEAGPIEFTILEKGSNRVLVGYPNSSAQSAEGALLGCEDIRGILLPGKLKMLHCLAYEIDSKKVDSGPDGIKQIELFTPGMKVRPFVFWKDCE